MKNLLLWFIVSLFLVSCSGDDTISLSGDYYLRMEGKKLNDILSHKPSGGEVPSNVIAYGYNSDFIIAKQKPNDIDDPLYGKHVYKNGRDTIYYWLIVSKQGLVIGPLSENDFILAQKKYYVPSNIRLESLN